MDMLRAVAAVEVVLCHARVLHAGAPPFSGLWQVYIYGSDYSTQAVVLFFVLSGFVIHLRLASQRHQQRPVFSVSGFLRNRALRIYPPLLFALVVTFVLDRIGSQINPWWYANQLPIQGETSIKAFVAAFIGLTGVIAATFGSNSPLWSLAYEILYYFAYVCIALTIVRRASWAIPILAGCALISLAVAGHAVATNCVTHCHAVVVSFWILWLAGAILAEVHVLLRARLVPFRMPVFGLIATLVALALLVGAGNWVWDHSNNWQLKNDGRAYLTAAGFLLVCFSLLHAPQGLVPSLARLRRVLLPVTAASYSLYIVHAPVIYFVGALAGPRLGWWLLIIGLAAVAVVVTVCYWFTERPITGGRRTWTHKSLAQGAEMLKS
jgi:peptidoglycan/LPS O-acetylase OafA/YrhL